MFSDSMPPWLSGIALHWYIIYKNAEVPSSILGGGFLLLV